MIPFLIPHQVSITSSQNTLEHKLTREEFEIKLINSVAQAWDFLPYYRVTKLHYCLYVGDGNYVASVSSGSSQAVIFWTSYPGAKYLHIVPSGVVKQCGDALIIDSKIFKFVASWQSPSPAID